MKGTFMTVGAVVAVIVIAWAGYTVTRTPSTPEIIIDENPKTYASETYGLSFEYPSLYFLTEINQSGANNTHAIILAEDTEENRDVFAGKSPGREGPPTIGVFIYDVPQGESLENWIRTVNESNFNISSDQTLSPTTVAGIPGFSYIWSGLYEGRSVAVLTGGKIFVFAETYFAPGDRIRSDFKNVVQSVKFSEN